jgi:hypothetical protein
MLSQSHSQCDIAIKQHMEFIKCLPGHTLAAISLVQGDNPSAGCFHFKLFSLAKHDNDDTPIIPVSQACLQTTLRVISHNPG